MSETERSTVPNLSLGPKPTDDDVDVFGLTHTGKVREDNQDHFLICSLSKRMEVHQTSLPELDRLDRLSERLAFMAMVADGVGGGALGGEASRAAVEAVAQYCISSMNCYYTADPSDEREFVAALAEAALESHNRVLEQARALGSEKMATTLTLLLGVWPKAYLLQVGDSRYYLMRQGELTQVSRDQTMAQDLVDQGVFSKTEADRSRWAHVLSSAIGGSEAVPVVTPIDNDWGTVHLLCSDGLTKHVSDDVIRERLAEDTSARETAKALLKDALAGGGTDNITIIVGRVARRPEIVGTGAEAERDA